MEGSKEEKKSPEVHKQAVYVCVGCEVSQVIQTQGGFVVCLAENFLEVLG